jgi:hypothetical protein
MPTACGHGQRRGQQRRALDGCPSEVNDTEPIEGNPGPPSTGTTVPDGCPPGGADPAASRRGRDEGRSAERDER